MRRVFLNDRSERDLVEIARYITRESGNRQVARAFIRRVREKCENLASFPGIAILEGHRDFPSVFTS